MRYPRVQLSWFQEETLSPRSSLTVEGGVICFKTSDRIVMAKAIRMLIFPDTGITGNLP